MPNDEETKGIETETETNTDEQNNGDETETETIDWKAKYEAEEGRRRRLEKQLSKSDTGDKKAPSKSDELDYGQKAFLVANGVKEQDEMKLVTSIMKDTGKTLDDVLQSKYFLSELQEMREAKVTANAVPSGTKRTGQSAQDSVEYWLAKGELPSDRELRTKVVNARYNAEKNKNVFYNS